MARMTSPLLLQELLDDYFSNAETADQEYAVGVIDRMYSQIMD